MKISVAIATYNRSAMVREAVEAALEQTLLPDQIVVSDDASTDRTVSVLAELAASDPRLRVLRQAANSGGVENWNIAMRAASETGDYIAWCSDDDRFTPEHLRTSVGFLECHPEIGVVHSSFNDSFETVAGSSRELRRLRSARPIVIGEGSFLRYMARYYDWPFHPSTIVMRRQMWESVGDFDRRFQLADTDWFVRAALSVKIAWLPRYGAINRRHPGNWSNRVGSAGMQREIFSIVERAIASRPFVKRAMSRVLWRATVRARLLLTLRDRIREGHGDAACAAWNAMVQGTGRRLPGWIARLGEAAIRRFSGRGEPERALSVRPL
jgi:glycosyltransferase involved in cell wall biosynthesis